MEIEYKFFTGEKVTVEVYGNFEEIILELDQKFRNHERKETRRHESIENFDDKSDAWSDKDSESTEERIFKNFDKDKLYEAILKITPQEQDLVHKLYLDKNSLSQLEYSKIIGTSENSVKQRLKRIRTKLKNLL